MSNDTEYNPNTNVTAEEMETILMLLRKMEDPERPAESDMPEGSHQVPVSASGAPPSPPSSAMNKRKRGKPQRALSSTVVPLAPSNVMLGSPSSLPFIDHAAIRGNSYYDEQRGCSSSSEQESNATHNIMSIQHMLNSSNGLLNAEPREDDEEYAEKNWQRSSDKKRGREAYTNDNDYSNASWQEQLEKAVRGKQEKELLDELATILETPTKDFPHNTARLCYAKLEALKLLRETCNRGLISEELYAEKQQEFLDSMQF